MQQRTGLSFSENILHHFRLFLGPCVLTPLGEGARLTGRPCEKPWWAPVHVVVGSSALSPLGAQAAGEDSEPPEDTASHVRLTPGLRTGLFLRPCGSGSHSSAASCQLSPHCPPGSSSSHFSPCATEPLQTVGIPSRRHVG